MLVVVVVPMRMLGVMRMLVIVLMFMIVVRVLVSHGGTSLSRLSRLSAL
jgi:hypothetical protein